MAQSGNAQTVIHDADSLREALARFQDALPHVATGQIVTTILPLIALLVAMHAGLAFGWWPLLALGLPAAALTVRTFIIQHDCGHGSFFRARRANDLLGRLCSLLTLTPYSQWRRHHAKHHGAWNDLDRRNASGCDIYSSCLTVAEYNALGTWRRRLHRTAKHPAISLLVLPPLIFLVLYRFPFAAPRTWRAQRRSVHLTNLSLVALHGSLAAMLGVGPVAAVLLAVIVPASIVGVWLFSLQHQFDGAHWARHVQWYPVDAA
ncbi:MAG: fatty acid desaturase family protein, partial [Acetobacteraceae bacterium]